MTNSYSNYLHDNMKGWNMECLTAHIVDWDQSYLLNEKIFFRESLQKMILYLSQCTRMTTHLPMPYYQ